MRGSFVNDNVGSGARARSAGVNAVRNALFGRGSIGNASRGGSTSGS